MKPLITKCICNDTSFSEMKEFMFRKNINSPEELIRLMKVADNCTLCIPYIRLMTETGETEFGIISESESSECKTRILQYKKENTESKNL